MSTSAPPAIFTQTKRSVAACCLAGWQRVRWMPGQRSCEDKAEWGTSLTPFCSCVLLCSSLREAVSLINGLAVKRLPLILNRVLVHLKDRTAAIFNGDELAQLSTLFNLELEQIHTILDSMSYIYEQAAYHLLNSEKLKAQLLDVLQLSEQPATAIAYVWNEQREAYMVNLRERSFGLPLVSAHSLCSHASSKFGIASAREAAAE
jgi:hypothetical protein